MIAEIAAQANKFFAGKLKSPLQPFTVGALGFFPFYWQDSNHRFNSLTYKWLNSNVLVKLNTVALDQPFTLLFISALAKVSYHWSNDDQHRRAAGYLKDKHSALLEAWKQLYKTIPVATAPQQPIDIILNTIATTWAYPATNITTMRSTVDPKYPENLENLKVLLNKVPDLNALMDQNNVVDADRLNIIVILSQYLAALNKMIPSQNESSMNTGLLQDALKGVQSATVAKGGLITTEEDVVRPAFSVNTPVSEILEGLNATTNLITVETSVETSVTKNLVSSVKDSGILEISVNALSIINSPIQHVTADAQLATKDIEDVSNLKKAGNLTKTKVSGSISGPRDLLPVVKGSSSIKIPDNPLSILPPGDTAQTLELTFSGVTFIEVGPVPFDLETRKNWYWPDPIAQANKNTNPDNSGFHFSPKPQIDFSETGPFGFITGICISRFPLLKMTSRGDNYQSIFKDLSPGPNTLLHLVFNNNDKLKFILESKDLDHHNQATTLSFSTPVDQDGLDSRAYVLGVQTKFPASGK